MRIVFLILSFFSFLTTGAFAALTLKENPLYLTAGKSLELKNFILGGTAPLSFKIVAGYYGTITTTGYYTAPERITTTKITVTDSSVPAQTLTFGVVSPPLSLRLPSAITMGPGKTKDVIIDGGVPAFVLTPSGNFTPTDSYQKFIYTSPTTPGNYTISVTDKIKSSTKTVTVEVAPRLVTSTATLALRANTGAPYNVSGGKTPYTCSVIDIPGSCDATSVRVGSTTGKGYLVIKDASEQEVRILLDVAAMSLSQRSFIASPGEVKTIAIYGGASPFYSSSTSAVISGSSITYTAPANPSSFSIWDSAANKATIPVEVVGKLGGGVTSTGINTTKTLLVSGGKAPFTFTKVSGVGSVTTSGSFTSTTTGTATISVRDSYSTPQTTTITVNVIAEPTVAISANRSAISSGEKVLLTWTQSGATSLTLNGTDVTGKTQLEVAPTATTTYELIARNAVGMKSASTSVAVTAPATVLPGTFVASEFAPGCDPTPFFNDVLDKARGHQRRIEPKQCEIVRVSRPSFVWRVLENATYELVIMQGQTTVASVRTPIPRYLHTTDLPNGTYTWHVNYYFNGVHNPNLVVAKRTFKIDIKNPLFKIPSGADIVKRASEKPRPRALPSGTTWSTVISRASSDLSGYKYNYQAYLTEASAIVGTSPQVFENKTAANFPNNDAYQAYVNQVKQYTMDERERIEYLGYAYYLTKDTTFLRSGLQRAMNLARLSTDGASSEKNQDQANREIILALAVSLDLFGDNFAAADRSFLVSQLKNRLAQVYLPINRLEWDPYMGHTLSSVHYVTEALMYLIGLPEFPEAVSDLQKMWVMYVTIAGTWGGQDGGYANGTSYGWYSLGTLTRSLAAIKLIANVNMFEYEPLGNIGMNQIAQTIPGIDSRGLFGDETEEKRHFVNYAHHSFRLLANTTRREDYEWYWRFASSDKFQKHVHPFHFLLLGAYSALPKAAPSTIALPNHYVFEDAGYVTVHSDVKRQDRSTVLFRASRFSAFNHAHADNNSFNFVSKGKDILISAGYYPNYDNEHFRKLTRSTRYHNALTFDNSTTGAGGIGQAESERDPQVPTAPIGALRDTSGKLVNFHTDGNWTIMTGDATASYQGYDSATYTLNPFLSAAFRTVAYNRALGLVVIYDYASSTKSRVWELNFHSLVDPVIPYSNGLRITNSPGSACIDVFGPNGEMKKTSGFPIAPKETMTASEALRYADQYHSKYRVFTATPEFVSLTVLREGCGAAPSRSISGTSRSITADGKTITFDKNTVKIQ